MSRYGSRDAWDPTVATSPGQDALGASGPSPAAERAGEGLDLGRSPDLAPPGARPALQRASRLPWALLGIGVAAAAAAGGLVWWPQVRAHEQALADLAAARAQLETLGARASELERKVGELEGAEAALQSAVEEKDAALAELTRTQEELTGKLQAEIQKGDVLIKQRRGELVVDLVDQILFDSGEAELNEQGKAAIRKVGETFLKIPDKVIQVGGHTDAVPISSKLVEKFPTNWELSATRATNVVHFLQDEVELPGERLVATGFSQYRPAASNRTTAGRRKNRRIEIVLLPVQAVAATAAAKR